MLLVFFCRFCGKRTKREGRRGVCRGHRGTGFLFLGGRGGACSSRFDRVQPFGFREHQGAPLPFYNNTSAPNAHGCRFPLTLVGACIARPHRKNLHKDRNGRPMVAPTVGGGFLCVRRGRSFAFSSRISVKILQIIQTIGFEITERGYATKNFKI